MIDLREYYLDHVSEEDYYCRFHNQIIHINDVFDIFEGYRPSKEPEYKFLIEDADEAIRKFKALCQPGNEPESREKCCWFYLLAYYLDSNGYYIEQFPNILSRPPEEPHKFIYNQIRNRAFELGMNRGNTVKFETRRKIISNMNFIQRGSTPEVSENLDELFKIVSTRSARFRDMTTEEQLASIANAIEYLLKQNGNFLELDYAPIAFDYLNDETVKKYRKQVQCFRHASNDSIAERAAYTKEQKEFLVDFGVIICKAICSLTSMS